MVKKAIKNKMNTGPNGTFQPFPDLMKDSKSRKYVRLLIYKFKTLQEALDQPDNYLA